MTTSIVKNLEKVLGHPLVITIISINIIVFLIIGTYFIGQLSSYAITALIFIYVLSIINSLITGTVVFKFLNIETINSLEKLPYRFNEVASRFNKVINQLEYKDLVVDITDYIDYLPKKEMIVFGVDFSLTGGKSQESDEVRKNLLKFLKQDNTQAIYICTPPTTQEYDLILDNIMYFLQKVNFKEIKEKITIYRREENPLYAKVTLLDYNLSDCDFALYQLGLFASDDFKSKTQNLAIKIDDEKAIRRLYRLIEKWRNESEPIDLEGMWQKLQSQNRITLI